MTLVFGEREVGHGYVIRPSTYALIENERGDVAVIATPMGRFLPGGGIEMDESPEEAVYREVREECGLLVRSISRIAEAIQLVHSRTEDTFFEMPSVFFCATIEDAVVERTERDHETLWLPRQAAAASMAHESHAWALRRAAKSDAAPDGRRAGAAERPVVGGCELVVDEGQSDGSPESK